MIEFTQEQEEYINSDINQNIFLKACPGSGKTETIAAKLLKEMINWEHTPSGIAILSFTKSAANELNHRIFSNHKTTSIYPHFVGTFDSFILKNIVNPLSNHVSEYQGKDGDHSFSVVDKNANLFFLTTYKYFYQHIPAHQIEINRRLNKITFNTENEKINKILSGEINKFESWQMQDFRMTKKKCLDAGFLTYDDVEILAERCLTINPKTENFRSIFAKRFKLIIVDECQDLSYEQLNILQSLINLGTKVHLVGDLDQAIYSFRDVDPVHIKEFIADNQFTTFELTKNYRSCQKIVNICTKLITASKVNANFESPQTSCFILQYKEQPYEAVEKFLSMAGNYKNLVIVARGHNLLQQLQSTSNVPVALQKLISALICFDENNLSALNQSLTLCSEFFKIKLYLHTKSDLFNCPYTIESSLEWRLFLFNALKYFIENGLSDTSVIWRDWCRKATSSLKNLYTQDFVPIPLIEVFKLSLSKILPSPKGSGDLCISEQQKQTIQISNQFRTATIHGVKGETHDATLLLSTPNKKGSSDSHWHYWLANPLSEAARFAYVASSRPKYQLFWGVKELKRNERNKFEDLGFHII